MDTSTLPYRPCVGIVLLNAQDKVFVGERIDNPGAWQMPQGGIDPGESVEEAAFRELGEEVGTNEADILRIAGTTIRYDIPQRTLDRLPWGNQYRGQEQTWVAMRFLGADADINLESHDPAEFTAWQWVGMNETLDLIVPFKRETYREVISLFADLVSG